MLSARHFHFYYLFISTASISLTTLQELLYLIKVNYEVLENIMSAKTRSRRIDFNIISMYKIMHLNYDIMHSIFRFKYDLVYIVVTHLVNQHYKICMRRGNGKEVICYIPCTNVVGTTGTTAGAAVSAQVMFMKVNIYEIKSRSEAYKYFVLIIFFSFHVSQVLDSGMIYITKKQNKNRDIVT